MEDSIEIARRRLDEFEAIEAIYPDQLEDVDENALTILHSIVESNSSSSTSLKIPSLCFSIASEECGGYRFLVEMEGQYPVDDPLTCYVRWEGGGRIRGEEISKIVQDFAQSIDRGCDSVMEVFLKAKDLIEERHAELQRGEEEIRKNEREKREQEWERNLNLPPVLGRRMIWSHHIKSVIKRKLILQWSGELQLGGFSKPGYPGLIIIEGPEDGVKEFIRRIFSLQWKAIQVRGEEVEEGVEGQDIDEMRKLQKEMIELEETGASILGQQCRQAGLEDLFLTSMKISR